MPTDPRVALNGAVDSKPFRRAVLIMKATRRLWHPNTMTDDVRSAQAETPIFWQTIDARFPVGGRAGVVDFLRATEPAVAEPVDYDRPGFIAEYSGGQREPVAYLPDF